MEIAHIEKQVKNILNEIVGTDVEVTNEVTLSDLGVDSLDEIEIVMGLEEEFNIEIPDDEIENLTPESTTVQQVIDFVVKKKS